MGLKIKLALLLALLVVASLSMGCMQQKTTQNLKTSKTPTTTATTTAKTTPAANVTQLEKDINATLDNVNQLLNQLNDIGNINFTV